MFLRRKKRITADVSELENDEKQLLSDFLRSSLKGDAVVSGDKASVDSEQFSLEDLKRLLNKFVYHKNLNNKYWVALEGNLVRVRRFDKAKKQEKRRKEETPPSTIAHGW